jgi:hypothetical protein
MVFARTAACYRLVDWSLDQRNQSPHGFAASAYLKSGAIVLLAVSSVAFFWWRVQSID